MIEVQNLVKRYGDHFAVDHLSFTAEQNKIYGFLGPNGAGKTTTMNIMTGCLGATEGTVKINGIDILDDPEKAKKAIGYLPEIPPLYPDMTVLEYLQFAAELKKIPKAERNPEVIRVSSACSLDEVQNRLIRNLSKGFKQRVGLANALLGSPEILILDEPTVGLDPKQILEIRNLVHALAEQHTVILSSHILSEVNEVCDHIFILSHGKLVACDTPEGLEQQFHTNATIELTIKGPSDQVSDVLSSIPELPAFQLKPETETGMTHVELTSNSKEELCETLFFAFADAKLPILRMVSAKASLEEIFLELTEDEQDTLPPSSDLEEEETPQDKEDKKIADPDTAASSEKSKNEEKSDPEPVVEKEKEDNQ